MAACHHIRAGLWAYMVRSWFRMYSSVLRSFDRVSCQRFSGYATRKNTTRKNAFISKDTTQAITLSTHEIRLKYGTIFERVHHEMIQIYRQNKALGKETRRNITQKRTF